jgi:hypothetical protein
MNEVDRILAAENFFAIFSLPVARVDPSQIRKFYRSIALKVSRSIACIMTFELPSGPSR